MFNMLGGGSEIEERRNVIIVDRWWCGCKLACIRALGIVDFVVKHESWK